MKLRIILYQKQLGETIPHADVAEMRDFAPHFVCFPEYFFVNKNIGNLAQTPHNQELQRARIRALSKGLDTVVVGGTMGELADGAIYNTSFVYDRGRELGFYRKKNLFFAEVGKVTPGTVFKYFPAYGFNFGVIICADIFDDTAFSFMKEHEVKIIFSPTFSLKKEETVEEKHKRDADIFIRGAKLSHSVIVKVCGVKSPFKSFLQARSLIASPDAILYRVSHHEEDSPLIIKKEIEI